MSGYDICPRNNSRNLKIQQIWETNQINFQGKNGQNKEEKIKYFVKYNQLMNGQIEEENN